MDFNTATGIAFYWFTENTELELDDAAITEHTLSFMRGAYDSSRVGSNWGYTPELAVQGQVAEYARTFLGWTHPQEGE